MGHCRENNSPPTDATQLVAYKKNSIKAKRLILDGVKDHVIPHVRGKDHAFEVWAALTSLYQNSNENRKMALTDKLKTIRMKGSESVVAYLSRFTDVRDELAAIGDAVADTELVRTTLQGFPKSWEVFVEGIVAREHLLGWDRLWSDWVQNEIRRSHGGMVKQEEEENVALVAKGRKGSRSKGLLPAERKVRGNKRPKKKTCPK